MHFELHSGIARAPAVVWLPRRRPETLCVPHQIPFARPSRQIATCAPAGRIIRTTLNSPCRKNRLAKCSGSTLLWPDRCERWLQPKLALPDANQDASQALQKAVQREWKGARLTLRARNRDPLAVRRWRADCGQLKQKEQFPAPPGAVQCLATAPGLA